MIKMVLEDGVWCPQAFCDHCGGRIKRGNDGNYEWQSSDPLGRLFFTHKRCCLAFEAANGGRGEWLANPLTVLPIYFAGNLAVVWGEAVRVAALLAGLSHDAPP